MAPAKKSPVRIRIARHNFQSDTSETTFPLLETKTNQVKMT